MGMSLPFGGTESALEERQVKLQIYDTTSNRIIKRGRKKMDEGKENMIFRSCIKIDHDEPEAEERTFNKPTAVKEKTPKFDEEQKNSRSQALMKGSKPKLDQLVSLSLALNLD